MLELTQPGDVRLCVRRKATTESVRRSLVLQSLAGAFLIDFRGARDRIHNATAQRKHQMSFRPNEQNEVVSYVLTTLVQPIKNLINSKNARNYKNALEKFNYLPFPLLGDTKYANKTSAFIFNING